MLASPLPQYQLDQAQSPQAGAKKVVGVSGSTQGIGCRGSPPIRNVNKRRNLKVSTNFSLKRLKISSSTQSPSNSASNSDSGENMNPEGSAEPWPRLNEKKQENSKSLNSSPLKPSNTSNLNSKTSISSINLSKLLNSSPLIQGPSVNVPSSVPKSQNAKNSRKRHIDDMDTDHCDLGQGGRSDGGGPACGTPNKKLILPYHHTAITTGAVSFDRGMYDDQQQMIEARKNSKNLVNLPQNCRNAVSSFSTCGSKDNLTFDEATTVALSNLTPKLIKSSFEAKFKYYKRLRQLPSQVGKASGRSSSRQSQSQNQSQNQLGNSNGNGNTIVRVGDGMIATTNNSLKQSTSQSSISNLSMASSSNMTCSLQNQSTNTNTNKKIFTDDAIYILEKILLEHESQMKEEFEEELRKRLNDQYESFVRYNEEYMKNNKSFDCSYLS